MVAEGSLRQLTNMAMLIKLTNTEHGFSVMRLICLRLRLSLSETNLDSFMQIFINGPDTFKMLQYFFHFFFFFFQKTENFEG